MACQWLARTDVSLNMVKRIVDFPGTVLITRIQSIIDNDSI